MIIFNDFLEVGLAFVHYSELGGSAFRGTDLLALIGYRSGALLFVHFREVAPISESPFREVLP